MTRIIESDIPGDVKSFTYVKNCHYLKLSDGKGRETTLVEHGLIRYECQACKFVWYAEENRCNMCPSCTGHAVEQQWMQPQLALIPEKETTFALQPVVNEDEPQED